MLPVCSATTCSRVASQSAFSYWNATDARCNIVQGEVPDLMNGIRLPGVASTKHPSFFINHSRLSSVANIDSLHLQNHFKDHQSEVLLSNCSYSEGRGDWSYPIGNGDVVLVERSNVSAEDSPLMDFMNAVIKDADVSSNSGSPDISSMVDITRETPYQLSVTLNVNASSVPVVGTEDGDVVKEISGSINDLVNTGVNLYNRSVDTVSSSISSVRRDANEALENVISKLMSNFDRAGESSSDKLVGFSSDLKEATGKLGVAAANLVRDTIIIVENTLAKGFTYVVFSYGSLKEFLPPDIQNALNVSETKLTEVFGPVVLVSQKGYSVLQGLEASLGLDPNDPIIPFVLFFGASGILWGSYWILTNAGYAGDLSPQETLELLKEQGNTALIDIRPEDVREKDGVPDLRLAARFRYASVTIPEVDPSVRKILKGGRNLDDMLVAAVIRNLNVVQGKSKIIVMDADGSRSKGVARSLRKLGIKNSYLLQGGFQSWVKDSLRIKELRPETTLQILNEEAEAIIEDINVTPLKLLGYGLGLVAASYALKEWEKTLQLIAIIGIGQTIYRRLASYEDAEDLKQDVSLVLAPVRLGGQAFSWAAGKLEPSRNGLPTSPSSSDVQSRVLQAAAKHESQPNENEEASDSSSELAASNEKADLSEA